MRGHLLGDRTDDEREEAAVPASTDDQQLGLPAGFDEQADDRTGHWTLPGGAASPGARLHAAFAHVGDYTLRYQDAAGEVTALPVVVAQ